jgi:ATP synthase subunit 6
MYSPFEQFKIFDYVGFNYNLLLTNSLLQLCFVLFTLLFLGIVFLYGNKNRYNSSFLYSILRLVYVFVYNTIYVYMGKDTKTYFPFFLYVFFFIMFFNLVGLLPYSFTLTSHLSVTIGLAFTLWYAIVLVGIDKWGFVFFSIFVPHGSSGTLVLVIAIIEFISYVSRVASLALRLLANMVAGHIILDCLIFLIYSIIYNSVNGLSVSVVPLLYTIIPIYLLLVILVFEFGVALLQSYIFILLSSIYLKEVH